jgi:hypothetical protein
LKKSQFGTLAGLNNAGRGDEARCLLAFSAAIGHHFTAADHAVRTRADVLDLAARRLVT